MKQSYLNYGVLIILLYLFFITTVKAQSLIESRKTSYYTYIYQISSAQAREIYNNSLWKIDSTFFHTKIDSFPTDGTYSKALPEGHYLQTYSEENQQKVAITSIQNFEAFVLNNNTDLQVQVYDLDGQLISDAEVEINNRNIKFHRQDSAYTIKKANKEGLLAVKVKGFTAFYNLERDYNNPWTKRAFRRVVYGTPLKYAWKPVRFVIRVPIDGVKSIVRRWPYGTIYSIKEFFIRAFHNTACLFDEYYCDYYGNRNEDKHSGYLVFNKPKYLPGDTVKLKAFIVKENGKPIKKELNATIYHKGKNIKLATISPYRKGAYEASFVLHDSLDLQLDRDYRLSLESENDEDYISNYFKYEDYELKSITLKLRTNEQIQYKNDSISFFVKGTNENDLNILDGKLEVLVTPLDIDDFLKSTLFVPDTLLYLEKALKAEGETEITLRNDDFPALNFSYNVNVKLITSDNEVISKNQEFTYVYHKADFNILLKEDSIYFNYEKNGIAESKDVLIYQVDNFGNKTLLFDGPTPTQVEYNQYFSKYLIESDSLKKSFDLSGQTSLIQCFSERNPDSLIIQVDNPRNLPFSYSLYKKNREVASGYAKELSYKRKTSSKKNYFISLQYLWGGEIVEENYEIPLREKELNVAIAQPRIVYPGQKSTIELTVTDTEGNPVENVDLTAYSVTKKFGYRPPSVPYLGKERKHKELINLFHFDNSELSNSSTKLLNYDQWKQKAGLDSVEYYQFIYPENDIRQFTYSTIDSVTQFAPFVFKDGADEPVHVVYVDGKPVYFSWSNHKNPYSFRIDSGYHQVKLRTRKNLFTIDSLYFRLGEKQIFSIDEESTHKKIRISDAEPELSQGERNFLHKYVFPYRNNFGQRYAYIQQGEHVHFLNPSLNTHRLQYFAGPIVGDVTFHSIENYTVNFEHEPFFEYDFAPKLLKMRSVSVDLYPRWLNSYTVYKDLKDTVLTEQNLKTAWQEYLDAQRSLTARYTYPNFTEKGAGRLLIKPQNESFEQPINVLVFRYDDPEFIRVYPGYTSLLHDLKKGLHQLIFFYSDAKYHVEDSVNIAVNGLNYYEYSKPEILEKDSFSLEINKIIEANIFKKAHDNQEEKREISSAYRERFKYSGVGEMVEGYVYLEGTEEALPGVNVLVKGTSFGVNTDLQGYYSMKVPYGYNTLQFSFIGMVSQERQISGNTVNVGLQEDVQQLSEVVVVGYGAVQEYSLSKAESSLPAGSLKGKVAGVSISSGAPGGAIEIKIRGAASQSFASTPLYIINGMVYSGDISELDPNIIKGIEVLKGEAATALYGSQAANGVVIIDTEEGAFKNPHSSANKGADYDDAFLESAAQSSAIRNNFSDYAFWQPALKTNKNGKASFEVKFPDDVTGWETFYLAMNSKKQSGQTKSFIKSYKPLMAQLAVPRFLVQNDTAIAIGKVLNYTNDSLKVKSQFDMDGEIQFSKEQILNNSLIDSLQIVAPTDSVTIKYFMEKEDGYFDGEEKYIPVFPAGLEETEGAFYTLENDTTFSLNFNPALGEVSMYARADLLDIIKDEISHVLNYEYYCNEQIASKLKALLVEKSLAEFKGEKSKNEREIKKLIRLLYKNQTGKGLWGWWKNLSFNDWISLHALEAMVLAEGQGYETKIDKEQVIEQMIWELEYQPRFFKSIRILRILQLLDAKVDYSSYIRTLEQQDEESLNALLSLTRLKQLCQMDYDVDTFLTYQKSTLFGNLYFENDSLEDNLVTNDLQNTLLSYQILQADSGNYKKELQKMRGYFLEKRNNGYWRNTYESAKIIETILPDLLNGKKEFSKPAITLSGDIDQTVSEFPFEMKLQPDLNVTLSKSGDFPVYFTSYQRFWNSKPISKKGDFEIITRFEDGANILTAGKETKLMVKVKVEKDAEYVMINIPIPGSCSYASKPNNMRGEAHREYFKNKATIFIERLPKGNYTYEINLMPRYSGVYALNPAKIELMYFPTFNANNEIKKVEVR